MLTFSQKRKRVARRMLRLIEWKLTKIYNHGFTFPQTEAQLIKARDFYDAQLEHQKNIFSTRVPKLKAA